MKSLSKSDRAFKAFVVTPDSPGALLFFIFCSAWRISSLVSVNPSSVSSGLCLMSSRIVKSTVTWFCWWSYRLYRLSQYFLLTLRFSSSVVATLSVSRSCTKATGVLVSR
jgi:hypothetical protein